MRTGKQGSTENAWLAELNRAYERLHTAKEDAFWSARMGLALDPGAAQAELARREIELARFLSDDEIESIHLASLKVLEELGMEVILNTEALDIFRKAGARVEGERVRIGREIVEEQHFRIGNVPSARAVLPSADPLP